MMTDMEDIRTKFNEYIAPLILFVVAIVGMAAQIRKRAILRALAHLCLDVQVAQGILVIENNRQQPKAITIKYDQTPSS